jgi:hypothetical protein
MWYRHRFEADGSARRPGGRLCAFWIAGHHADDLADALQAAYQRVLAEWPNTHDRLCGEQGERFDGGLQHGHGRAKGMPEIFGAAHGIVQVEPQINGRRVARPAALPQRSHRVGRDDKRELFEEIGETVDRFGGLFDMTYNTLLISAIRSA